MISLQHLVLFACFDAVGVGDFAVDVGQMFAPRALIGKLFERATGDWRDPSQKCFGVIRQRKIAQPRDMHLGQDLSGFPAVHRVEQPGQWAVQ